MGVELKRQLAEKSFADGSEAGPIISPLSVALPPPLPFCATIEGVAGANAPEDRRQIELARSMKSHGQAFMDAGGRGTSRELGKDDRRRDWRANSVRTHCPLCDMLSAYAWLGFQG